MKKILKKHKTRLLSVIMMLLAISTLSTSCDPLKPKDSGADMLTFSFEGMAGTATIDQKGQTVVAKAGSSVDLATVVAVFTLSEGAVATVNGVAQVSGVSINSFIAPVTYKIAAPDGTSKNYVVTITKDGEVVTELTNSIINTGDKTLAPGIYLVKNSLSLSGPNRLTLSPGVVLKFANDVSFSINDNATLIARGTAALPILFTSERSGPQPGDWGYLRIGKCDASVLEYCVFEYGSNSTSWGMVTTSCEMTINNCTFRNSKYTGLWLYGTPGFVEFSNNTFVNCANSDVDQHPMRADHLVELRNMGSGNTFTNTVPNKGILVMSSTLQRNMTLKKTNVPYYFQGGTNINSSTGAILTIDPGVQIKMMQQARIDVGDNGKIVAQGTAADRIKITGLLDQKGYWDYITFHSGVQEGNILEYCDIINGGRYTSSWEGAIYLYNTRADQIAIKNCHIAKTLGYGIFFYGNSEAVLENNTFSDCGLGETNK
jgi:parallel beta-helix repeat protein